MSINKNAIVILLAVFLGAQFAHAQRWLNSNGGPAVNPNSGMEVDPTFCYNPADGVLSVYNAGPNGIDDTMGGAIDGDDFGFTSLLLTASSDILSEPIILPFFQDGIAWAPPVFFNGKIQLSGNAVSSPGFVAISEDPVPIIQLLPGLTADDFRNDIGIVSIETGDLFTIGSDGGISSVGDAFETGAFKIVPEPNTLILIMVAGIALIGLRRR